MSVGLHIMTPTSIVVAGSGSTASIRADGGVDFATATSLSLNGVFTSAYDDYMIVIRHVGSAASGLGARLRLSGTDATASNYTFQLLEANGTSVAGSRSTSQTRALVGSTAASQPNGDVAYIYGPSLAQPTAFRNVNVRNTSGAYIADFTNTHSVSTAYDGITFLPDSGSFSGMVTVYGYAQ